MKGKTSNFIRLIGKIVCLTIILVMVNNIISQLNAVKKARIRNQETKKEIIGLIQDNIALEEKIRYATSSAFFEASLRNYLGLGSANDYWVILPDMSVNTSQITEEKTEENNYQLWWDLFTKGI